MPFINVFKPYQVLSEIYKAGAINSTGGDGWKKFSGSGMLLAWWVFWVITHMMMTFFVKLALKKTAAPEDLTLNQIIGSYQGGILLCVASLLVAGLWFIVAGGVDSPVT